VQQVLLLREKNESLEKQQAKLLEEIKEHKVRGQMKYFFD